MTGLSSSAISVAVLLGVTVVLPILVGIVLAVARQKTEYLIYGSLHSLLITIISVGIMGVAILIFSAANAKAVSEGTGVPPETSLQVVAVVACVFFGLSWIVGHVFYFIKSARHGSCL